MPKKELPITYEEAILQFYGGLIMLATQPFPFACLQCGARTAYSVADCFVHIRQAHKQVIKGHTIISKL